MFFDRFQALCEKQGVSVYRACMDAGRNRSAVAKWKAGGKPNGTSAGKLAAYLGVTTDYLLCGNEPQNSGRQPGRRQPNGPGSCRRSNTRGWQTAPGP